MTTELVSSEIITMLLPILSTVLGFVAIKFKDSFNKIKSKAKLFESLLTEINASLEDNKISQEESARILKLLRGFSRVE